MHQNIKWSRNEVCWLKHLSNTLSVLVPQFVVHKRLRLPTGPPTCMTRIQWQLFPSRSYSFVERQKLLSWWSNSIQDHWMNQLILTITPWSGLLRRRVRRHGHPSASVVRDAQCGNVDTGSILNMDYNCAFIVDRKYLVTSFTPVLGGLPSRKLSKFWKAVERLQFQHLLLD